MHLPSSIVDINRWFTMLVLLDLAEIANWQAPNVLIGPFIQRSIHVLYSVGIFYQCKNILSASHESISDCIIGVAS